MYNGQERRKYGRIELTKRKDKKIVTPYIARFRVKQYEDQEMSFPDWNIVAVKNLSAGGMLFDYNKNLELDSLLDLKIDFFKSIPSINCIGRVVRIEEPMPNSMSRIAVKFTEIDEKEKEMINTTVEAILRKETKKKNFYLEKLEKLKNAMARKVTRSTGIKKEFLKTKNVCRVTFSFPKKVTPYAKGVSIVCDFNNWDIHANPMKKVVVVVRIEEPMPNSMSSIAAKFTEIDEKEKEMINTTVEATLRKETKKMNFYLEKLEKMKDMMTRGVTMEETRLELEQAKHEELEKTRLEQEQAKHEELEKTRLEREQAKHEELEKTRLEREQAKHEELEKIRREQEQAKDDELEKIKAIFRR